MSAGVREGLEWTVFDTPVTLAEVTAPTIVEDNTLKLYAKDKSGVSALFYKGDDEVEVDLSGGITGSGAAGQVAFWTGATVLSGENNLFWNSTDNRLGIGTVTPLSDLEVVTLGSALPRGITQTQYSTDGNAPGLQLRKARGTEAAPTLVVTDDPLGEINFFGYTGSAFVRTAIIQAKAGENYSGTNQGSYLRFFTIPLASTTLTEWLRLGPDGVVQVNQLTASQFVTTDASKNLVSNDHLGAADPHTGYRLESADHSHQSTGLQAGQLDHGLALVGLGDDDHSLYLLASDATSRALFATNWLDLTDGGATTLHSHAGGGISIGDTITSGTTGSVLFVGAGPILAQDNANFFWNDTDNRLGIGTATPGSRLEVAGASANASASVFTQLFRINGNTVTNVLDIGAQADAPYDMWLQARTSGDPGNFLPVFFNPLGGLVGVGPVAPGISTKFNVSGTAAQVTVGTEDLVQYTRLISSVFPQVVTFGVGRYLNDGGSNPYTRFDIKLKAIADSTLSGEVVVMSLQSNGNVILNGGSPPTTGTQGIVFADGTAFATMVSNTAGIYADSMGANVEMMNIDESNRVRSLAWPRDVRVATQFDKTSDTTLANVTNLTHNVNAGKTYSFEARLFTASAVSGGVKAAISGTATVTSIVYEGLTIDAGVTTQSRTTTLGNAVGAVTAVITALMIIKGTVVVDAAGTLTVQFAQNVIDATPSSVLINSSFVVDQLP